MSEAANELRKKRTAEILLSIGAVEFKPEQPFTYASGLKGPIYCDNRKLLSHPSERAEIRDFFVEIVKECGLSFDHLAGLATAGIPHAAFIADKMDKSMVYVRSKPKAHGRRNQIEGDYREGQKLLLVEDLVNQGASLNEALLGVEDAGLKAVGCLAIVTYDSEASHQILKEWSLPLVTLTDFHTLSEAALKLDKISQRGRELLRQWQQDPVAWSNKF